MSGKAIPKAASRGLWRALLVMTVVGLIGFAAWVIYGQVLAGVRHGGALEATGRRDFAGALELLERYLTHHPTDAEATFLAARTARRAGDLRRAGHLLDEADRLGWVPAPVLLERSLLRVQRGGLLSEKDYLGVCLMKAGHPD